MSGEAYMTGMRRSTRMFIAETGGYAHPSNELTPEDLLAHWDQVNDVSRQNLTPGTRTWAALNHERIVAAEAR